MNEHDRDREKKNGQKAVAPAANKAVMPQKNKAIGLSADSSVSAKKTEGN